MRGSSSVRCALHAGARLGNHTMRGRRLLIVVPVVGLVVAAVFALGQGSGSSALTLYSGQHPETVNALVSAFERQSGIKVSVRSDDEDVLAAQIVQEGSRSPADVFLTENSPPLEELHQRGLLVPVDGATLAETPAIYSSPQGDWVGVSARVSVLVYNTRELRPSQLPGSVLALADPKWRGKLALAPAETDFQPIVTAVAARYGDARTVTWLEGLRRNAGSHIYPDNETIVAQVNSGQAELGVINHYYWYRLRDEIGAAKIHSAERRFSSGDPGYVIDVSGAGILASSHHQVAAQRFLAFLVSRGGEEILAHGKSYEYPLGSGVQTAKPLYPFAELRPDPITIRQLGNGQHAIALMRRASLL
jgi:iron(III) transport system substrate-binding protein